jgi:putative intracellular protease/amidase
MTQSFKAAHVAAIFVVGLALATHAGAATPSQSSGASTSTTQKKTYVCQMTPGPVQDYDKPGYCPTDGMELVNKTKLRVAVLVFDEAEIIDFTGPMEVFTAAGAKVFTVAPTMASVLAGDSLRIQPDYDIDHAPEADILVIPGGNQDAVTKNAKLMDWIRQRSAGPETLMSVCTGAFILGKAGLLDGKSATVTAPAMSFFAKEFPKTLVVRNRRFVDAGKIVTTGGLSAGIDGALHLVEREQGAIRAQDVARYLEYDWQPERVAQAGSLARLQFPNFALIFPADVSWERTVDRGDAEHWEIQGQLGLAMGPDAFLDAGAEKIKAKGWTLTPSVPVRTASRKASKSFQRSFTKLSDGQTWTLEMTVIGDDVEATHRMTLVLRKANAVGRIALSK